MFEKEIAKPQFTTTIDSISGDIPSTESLLIGFSNISEGVKRYVEGGVPESHILKLAKNLGYRTEAVSHGNYRKRPQQAIRDICDSLLSLKYFRDRQIPQDKNIHIMDLSLMIDDHLELKTMLNPMIVSVDSQTRITMVYDNSQWEGIGALKFFVSHTSLDDYPMIPFFVLRGNPFQSPEGIGFAIRTVQPWISDYMSSISGIKKRYDGMEENYSKKQLEEIDSLLSERNRVVDIFLRANAWGQGIKSELRLNPAVPVFLLACAYFQRNGVRTITGIKHEFHPSVIHDKGFGVMSLNYDKLFMPYMEYTRDNVMYPWKLEGTFGSVVIPRFSELPSGLRQILAQNFS